MRRKAPLNANATALSPACKCLPSCRICQQTFQSTSPLFLVSSFFCPEATHIGQIAALLCRILRRAMLSVWGTTCKLAKGNWLQRFPLFSGCLLAFSAAVVFDDAYPLGTSRISDLVDMEEMSNNFCLDRS